jgi:ABC-type microcin C transport system duplicated ATPase subunit YejF
LRKEIQIIWQDPTVYLNPFLTVRQLIEEPLICFSRQTRFERRKKVLKYLNLVELDKGLLLKRPHELSGGQCQRVAMARAVILNPSLVILDEALSGFDADLQVRILDLLKRLRRDKGFAYLFISHDLRQVAWICPNLAILKNGRIRESGPTSLLLTRPSDPYTKKLLSCTLTDASSII